MTVTNAIETSDAVCEYLGVADDGIRVALRGLQAAAAGLPQTPHGDLQRIDACHRLRLAQDAVFATSSPAAEYAKIVSALTRYLSSVGGLPTVSSEVHHDAEGTSDLDTTATHYGHLWGGFTPEHYFDEATALLRARLERNGFDFANVGRMRVLDAGCGGGRYSVALRRLGFGEVVGADWSKNGIAVANARIQQAKIDGVSYRTANMLELPFAESEFDMVFSNGVLHHTTDPERGIAETARVVKPGGRVWLYLYHRPGGLDRLTHYVARLLLKTANHEVCRRYCAALGLAANRIFFLLDLWLTPIAESYSPVEMDAMLKRACFRQWRRCTRGADDDLVEKIHEGEANAEIKYGVGENRYLVEA